MLAYYYFMIAHAVMDVLPTVLEVYKFAYCWIIVA